MTKEELRQYETYNTQEKLITVNDLANKKDRTLLFGYDCNRKTWHVYLKDGKIHTIRYSRDYANDKFVDLTNIVVVDNSDYIPDKRVYPSASDFEFCLLLKKAGCKITMTHPDDREEKKYYGAIKEDF